MLAKLLKRKDSRLVMDLNHLDKGQEQGQHHLHHPDQQLQYRYQRPDLLGKVPKVCNEKKFTNSDQYCY